MLSINPELVEWINFLRGMAGRRRVFIAINLPNSLREKLFNLKKRWPDLPCRWIKPENLHLTIIPPMYLDDDELARIIKSISEEVSAFPAFELKFEKIIYGPPLRQAQGRPIRQAQGRPIRQAQGRPANIEKTRMIWFTGRPSEELTNLKEAVSEAIFDASVPFREESRLFAPHVTLCRMNEAEWRNFEPKPEINESLKAFVSVASIEIMESMLRREGAEYTLLESIQLGKQE